MVVVGCGEFEDNKGFEFERIGVQVNGMEFIVSGSHPLLADVLPDCGLVGDKSNIGLGVTVTVDSDGFVVDEEGIMVLDFGLRHSYIYHNKLIKLVSQSARIDSIHPHHTSKLQLNNVNYTTPTPSHNNKINQKCTIN